MLDKKIADREAIEVKKISSHCLDNISDILKKIQFKVEDTFGDFLSKNSSLPEQRNKLNNFSAKMI